MTLAAVSVGRLGIRNCVRDQHQQIVQEGHSDLLIPAIAQRRIPMGLFDFRFSLFPISWRQTCKTSFPIMAWLTVSSARRPPWHCRPRPSLTPVVRSPSWFLIQRRPVDNFIRMASSCRRAGSSRWWCSTSREPTKSSALTRSPRAHPTATPRLPGTEACSP